MITIKQIAFGNKRRYTYNTIKIFHKTLNRLSNQTIEPKFNTKI